MKKLFLLLAASIGFAACESDEQSSAPFDDVIADFDVATIDPVELSDALTSCFVEEIGGNVHTKVGGWQPIASMLGRLPIRMIFYADGVCWGCVDRNFALSPLCPPYHIEQTWSLDTEKKIITIHQQTSDKQYRILYYKNDRLILETKSVTAKGNVNTYRIDFRMNFGEDVRDEKKEYYIKPIDEVLKELGQ